MPGTVQGGMAVYALQVPAATQGIVGPSWPGTPVAGCVPWMGGAVVALDDEPVYAALRKKAGFPVVPPAWLKLVVAWNSPLLPVPTVELLLPGVEAEPPPEPPAWVT